MNAALAKMAKEQHLDHVRRSRKAAQLAEGARTPHYRPKSGNRDQFGIVMPSKEELKWVLAHNAELKRASEWKALANRSGVRAPLKPTRIAKQGHRAHEVVYDYKLRAYRPIKEGVNFRKA